MKQNLVAISVAVVLIGCSAEARDVTPQVRSDQYRPRPIKLNHDVCYDWNGIEAWVEAGAWASGPPPGWQMVPSGRNDLCEYEDTCWYNCPCSQEDNCSNSRCVYINTLYGFCP